MLSRLLDKQSSTQTWEKTLLRSKMDQQSLQSKILGKIASNFKTLDIHSLPVRSSEISLSKIQQLLVP